MKHMVQEEYDKCLVLNNHINYKQILKEQEKVKKWTSKNKSQEKGKWKRKEQVNKRQYIPAITPPKTIKPHDPNTSVEFD